MLRIQGLPWIYERRRFKACPQTISQSFQPILFSAPRTRSRVRLSAPIVMNTPTITVRVRRKTTEAVGICRFELIPVEGELPKPTPGAHIDVHLPNGLVRQYSICNGPGESDRYIIGVLQDPSSRGGSTAFHAVAEGALLTISAPKNHFPLEASANHSVLVAGGIGITPILSMAEWLSASEGSFELHYCVRSRDRAAFVERLSTRPYADKVHIHCDDEDVVQRFDASRVLATPQLGVHLYVCGPTGFMNWVLDTAKTNAWPAANVHREFFGAAAPDHSADGSFDIKIASTGKLVRVEAGETAVRALAAAGIQIETSCEQGVCGTCLTRVLDGVPDHKDMYLTDGEKADNNSFLPCCSRAKSPCLVLDL